MATIHHQPYHHSSPSTRAGSIARPRRHSLDYSSLPSNTTTTSLSLKNTLPFSNMITFSTSTTTPTTSPDTTFSLDSLQRYLAAGNFRQADEETRRLLIILAGEAAIKRGYVFFSEVQFIPTQDLKSIDELWKKYSNNKFGYSVQKKIWVKVNKDFTRFFLKVGWMKKLDTEIEQYNYRSFPNEFIWEYNINDDEKVNDNLLPPEGHLPLTNALRGIQLLNCILSHPAFYDENDESQGQNGKEGGQSQSQSVGEESDNKKSRLASLRDRLFKPNYRF